MMTALLLSLTAAAQGEVLLASASAGTTAAVVTFPMDFVRTRLTVQTAGNTYVCEASLHCRVVLLLTGQVMCACARRYYRGVTNAVLSIYQQEGLLGFYKGVTAAVLVRAQIPLMTPTSP